ncbi:8745_t:CDS:2 [Paraglomus occultum]|uniref:8745_t:CDS:1 n=1 Tax=Paraglomus occultum TaxID=144539 RepID=A0A9N9F4S0_9GLOM|nr:8745_t:CDS:2 [Paraglomus occultum]
MNHSGSLIPSPSSPSTPTTPQSQTSNSSMTLAPPSPGPAKVGNNTFVHKLYKYGFHKVNKSPRGHRTLAENQIWEFSHTKFLRGRPDLLDDIKRKAMESETLRRETGDLHAQLTMMQVSQADLMQQLAQLQENFTEVIRELSDTKRKQSIQQQCMKSMWEIMQQQGISAQLPIELSFSDTFDVKSEPDRPPIYITSPENQTPYLYGHVQTLPQRPSTPLTINTNLTTHSSHSSHPSPRGQSPTGGRLSVQLTGNSYLGGHSPTHSLLAGQIPLSPNSLSAYTTAVNTPLPPSPSPGSPMPNIISDDDMDGASIYDVSHSGSHTPSEYGDDIYQ